MFKNKTISIIFFTIFIDMLGFGILIPVIPLLFASPMSEFYMLPAHIDIKTGYLLLGFLIAVYPIGQFFSTPILGQLSDKYGRKKILILSIIGTSLSYFIFAIGIVTKNVPLLFIARFFDGLTGGNISVAQAMIGDVSTRETRARNFGMIGAAFGLGFIFGPYIGGKLSDPAVLSWFSASTPFIFAGILATLNIIFITLFLKETNKNIHNEKITWSRSLNNIGVAYRMKGINIIFLTNFLYNGGFTFFTTFFSVYLINKFNFTQGNIGELFAYIGLWGIFTQAVMTRIVAKKFTEVKVIKWTLIGSGVAILAYFLPQYSWQLIFIPPFMGLFNGLSMSNLGSLLSHVSPEKKRGEILGINASVSALAQAIPALLSGFIAVILKPTTPIIFASVFILMGAFVFNRFYKNIHNN